MDDKVSELRRILNQKKAMEEQNQNQDQQAQENEDNIEDENAQSADSSSENQGDETVRALKEQIEELKKANSMQKDMYLRKVAEFENFQKRLKKEQEQHSQYANEKILEELLPVLDSLDMTLTHATDRKDDPLVSGVELTFKQFLAALEKYGIKQISGEGEDFDPNVQEAISTEKSEDLESGKVCKVLRKGYTLHGRLIRAAMVSVSE
ncbi:MAG: nucleotide exchange factor GrpE [Deltaproteobacteria bacterium]|nr:nucleotide exchange factor GrpE [Deltaproteobacteria bacterium]